MILNVYEFCELKYEISQSITWINLKEYQLNMTNIWIKQIK
jgi:hypothetical protein